MTLARQSKLAAAAVAIAAMFPAPARADDASKGAKKVSKSGIPYLSDEQVGPPDLVTAIKSRRAGGRLLNLDRMLLHSPNFAKGWNGMFAAIRNQLSLPGKLRELAIMQIGVLNKAEYEWAQHEGEFLKVGGTREQLDALRKGAAVSGGDPKLFDDAERATMALTREMTQKIDVSDGTMKRVRSLLPDPQVVELIGTIAGYNMVSRFVAASIFEASLRNRANRCCGKRRILVGRAHAAALRRALHTSVVEQLLRSPSGRSTQEVESRHVWGLEKSG